MVAAEDIVDVSLLKKATIEQFGTGLVTLCRVHRRSAQRALWRSWFTWVQWAAVETARQQMRVDFTGLVSRQAGICRGFLAYLFVGAARQLLAPSPAERGTHGNFTRACMATTRRRGWLRNLDKPAAKFCCGGHRAVGKMDSAARSLSVGAKHAP